jgi:hypothetical protein
MNKFKIRTLLQLLLFTLYVVWLVLVAFKIDINLSLMHVASVQEDLLQRILLVFSLIGIVLTSFYLNTLKNDQTKEKNNTKSLLAMYIVVAIMTLYSTDIAKYFKSFI